MEYNARLVPKAVILSAVALTPSMSSAHHSFAMFDYTKEIVLDGTVREYQWTNPHSWIQFTTNVGGKSVEYSIEMQSVSSLVRLGWSRNTLKAGDKLKIKFHPLKDGSNGGSFMSATFTNGRVLSGEAPP